MAGAIWFLYRIVLRLFDRGTAAIAAFVFLCGSSFFAVDARPYALPILCITVATWAILRWSEANRAIDAAMFIAAGALAVYGHCVLSLGLAAPIAYGAAVFRNKPDRLIRLGLMMLAIAALCVPLLPEVLNFYATRTAHAHAGRPGAGDILIGLIPCGLTGGLVVIVWIERVFRRAVQLPAEYSHDKALLAAVWALFAPLFLAALSSVSDIQLYVDRYFSCALPGQALITGVLLASIRPRFVRQALLITIALSTIVWGKLLAGSHGNDDWRSAMDLIHKEAGSAPVLLVSPFAEGADFRAVHTPALRDILFAPASFYGEPPGAIRLPHAFAAKEQAELEAIAARIQNEPRIYLIADKPDRSYETWLVGRLASRCPSEPLEQSFGQV
jgi:hypothetical protein